MSAKLNAPSLRSGEDFAWTPRQREVLTLIARGHTNGEIASALGISLDGAKWHVGEILSKLGTHSRDDAALYWREEQGLPSRMARLMRGFAPWKLVAGGAACAVALAAIIPIMMLFGEGRPTPVEPVVAESVTPNGDTTAIPGGGAASPTPDLPDTALGLPIEQFAAGPPVDIPAEGMMFLGLGCWQCDSGGVTPWRVYHDPISENVVSERVRLPGAGAVGQFMANGRGELFLLMCDPECPGGIASYVEHTTTIYRSRDGGFVWDVYDEFPGGMVYIQQAEGSRLLVQWSYGEPETNPESWDTNRYYLPGREFAGQASPGEQFPGPPTQLPGDDIVRTSASRDALVGEDGNVYWKPELGAEFADDESWISVWPEREERTVNWRSDPAASNVIYEAFYLNDRPERVYVNSDDLLEWTVDRWLAEGVGLGTGMLTAERMGNPPLGEHDNGRPVPAIIDYLDGTISPVVPETITEMTENGRANLVGFLTGPLARVVNAGTCLNVREAPAADSPIVRCYMDGVFLRDLDETVTVEGVDWMSVETPTGERGYASAEFLAR